MPAIRRSLMPDVEATAYFAGPYGRYPAKPNAKVAGKPAVRLATPVNSHVQPVAAPSAAAPVPPVSDQLLAALRSRGVPYTVDTKTHLANSVMGVAARLVAHWPRLEAPVAGAAPLDVREIVVDAAALRTAAGPDGTDVPEVASARQYVAEVLRRSRSPYALLQTAMFYLVRLRPIVAAGNATLQPSVLGCGRRMLLAALMLAGKYLNDKSFKTNAWSKISGLAAGELNANEAAVLAALDWHLKLLPETYSAWCDAVLDFARPFATMPPPPAPASAAPALLAETLLELPVPAAAPDMLSPAASGSESEVEDSPRTPSLRLLTPAASPNGSPNVRLSHV